MATLESWLNGLPQEQRAHLTYWSVNNAKFAFLSKQELYEAIRAELKRAFPPPPIAIQPDEWVCAA